MVEAILVTFATGVYSAAPAAVFTAILFNPTLFRFGIMTPCAPTQFAVHKIAPRLCGSVILSHIITNGASFLSLAIFKISCTVLYSYGLT